MMANKVGRPRQIRLLNIKEIIAFVENFWGGKVTISRQTIYNKFNTGELRRHGPFNCAMAEESQILEQFCKSYKKSS